MGKRYKARKDYVGDRGMACEIGEEVSVREPCYFRFGMFLRSRLVLPDTAFGSVSVVPSYEKPCKEALTTALETPKTEMLLTRFPINI